MPSLREVFCAVDDFCLAFLPGWRQQLIANGQHRRQRTRQLSLSEIMTILIAFHHSQYRTLQSLLHHSGPPPLASRVSRLSQLFALCGVHPFHLGPAVGLSPPVLGHVYRNLVCRRDRAGRVP